MSNTRQMVLKTLLNRQRCTISELAEAVGINPISVRHHIGKLEADNLVVWEEEHHGVGRPRRIYSLSKKGIEQFPSRYLNLSLRIIQQLKGSLPRKTVQKLFQEMGSEMVRDYNQLNLDDLNLEERILLLRQLLVNEGFSIEIEKDEDSYRIIETSCPFMHISEEHPEVCLVDETIIAILLDMPVEKTHCILNGDTYCAYLVPTTSTPDKKGKKR